MKKVIILGGSFDPIHKGHILILKEAMKELKIDEGWLMPAKNPRWKKGYTSINYRLKLLSKVIKEETNIKLCKEEINSKETNYTYKTILKLKEKYPNLDFYFLIGYDQLNLLNDWYEIDKLCKLVTFVVAKRPNYELNQENITKYNCTLLNYSGPDISSSDFKETLDLSLIPDYLHELIISTGDYYKRKLREMMNYHRYCHSLQVAKVAKDIAIANNYNVNKAFLASLLHDCAKDISKDVELKIMNDKFKKYMNEKPLVYHQFVGSVIVKDVFKINDEEIIDAIKWHTTGNENMSTLAKIVYAADKIEPTRGYDSKYMIDACLEDINSGFELVLKENYIFLVKHKGMKIDNTPLTLKCLTYYKVV